MKLPVSVVVYNGPEPDGFCLSGGLRHIINVPDYNGTIEQMLAIKQDYYEEYSMLNDTFVVCQGSETKQLCQAISNRFDGTENFIAAIKQQKGDSMKGFQSVDGGNLVAMLMGDEPYPGIDITFYPDRLNGGMGGGILVEAPLDGKAIRLLVYEDESDEPTRILSLGQTHGTAVPDADDFVYSIDDLTGKNKTFYGLVRPIVGGWLMCRPTVIGNSPAYTIEVIRSPKSWEEEGGVFDMDEWLIDRPSATVMVANGKVRMFFVNAPELSSIGSV